MRVLFLDIDGVLVTHRSHVGLHAAEGLMVTADPCSMGLLNRLVSDHDMKVVVSSTWRRSFDKFDLETILKCQGAQFSIHSYTPIDPVGRIRGHEIEKWIRDHNNECVDDSDLVDIADCLILDDDSDFTDEQLDRHVLTCAYDGMGFKSYCRAKVLMGDDSYNLSKVSSPRRTFEMSDENKLRDMLDGLADIGMIESYELEETAGRYELRFVPCKPVDKIVIDDPEAFLACCQ